MAEPPDWNPDTAGRSLAEILREAGIEAPRSGRRQRRWDDPDTGGIRQRRSEPPSGEQTAFGRRAGDLRVADGAPPRRRPAPDPSTAAIPIPDLRGPAGAREVPGPSSPPGGARTRLPDDRSTGRGRAVDGRGRPLEEDRPGETDRRAARGRTALGERLPERDRNPATDRRRREAEPAVTGTGRVSGRPIVAGRVDPHPSTGPIPVVRDGDLVGDDEPTGAREGAVAWLRFAGELVIALAVGVGVYLLATVLWEQLPYLAVVLAPLAVTGLVAGVGAFRRRHGHEAMGVPLLAVLVFAGALLTVMPAVTVLDKLG